MRRVHKMRLVRPPLLIDSLVVSDEKRDERRRAPTSADARLASINADNDGGGYDCERFLRCVSSTPDCIRAADCWRRAARRRRRRRRRLCEFVAPNVRMRARALCNLAAAVNSLVSSPIARARVLLFGVYFACVRARACSTRPDNTAIDGGGDGGGDDADALETIACFLRLRSRASAFSAN